MGLTAPLASQMLAYGGVAAAQTKSEYKPTRRRGGGSLKLLLWQGPTLLNPHFAVGTKDQEASLIFYEPLAGWDAEGNLVPMLAAEIPDLENGGLARDGMSVTWKLKQNVRWHDGEPFTADDRKLRLVCQTSINAPRQKTQAVVKQACQKAGIEVELKSVSASVYFSSDVANPDTYAKFYCDLQMYNILTNEPDPEFLMNQFVPWEIASKENKWQGRNITRWHSDEYDKAYRAMRPRCRIDADR